MLALGKDAHDLAGGKAPSPATSASLKTNQQLLVAVQPGLEPSLAPSFSDLVIKVGLVRIRTDTNTYVASLAPALMASYDAVVKACTTDPLPTATP